MLNSYFKNRIIFLILFYFLCSNILFASAWTRQQNHIFADFEILTESNNSNRFFRDINATNYKINSYKLYLEYGVTDFLTIGGYLKNYNFNYKYNNLGKENIKKIQNDYYGDLFLLYNFYNKNRNLISTELSFYFPIKTHGFSKEFNLYETEKSLEYAVLFGTDKDFTLIYDFMFFISSKVAYRIFDNINFNRLTFQNIIGFRLNNTSSVNFEYEYQNHRKTNFLPSKDKIYDKLANYNLNEFKISFNYKFLDNLSAKLSYFKKFSKVNSSGLTFSFIVEY